ncbi:hypothetical protein SELMODRAFT_270173 [Selaginella moellendorffii]|uniref:DUF3700 domain-containing protein n=1 Tax=Selaginella moellendorffii TaxID=88036 RepID=D8QQ82_SELML|nr:stem-specific protein TSJT1 [Selaginella moellendorffii]EFJ38416.1 hypothetical protein SELMODRAFT_270173 [Selaginella moellendorffii]|eukprot:XP_002960877.1 stem-specific protein TSJT1 [Selaginella moellendorffii]
MLAIFGKSVAQAPEQLSAACGDHGEGGNGGGSPDLVSSFRESYPEAVVFQAGEAAIAYSHERQALLKPRTFAVADDIFCVFEGILENLTSLKQQYGLSKVANEVLIVIEAYRNLRDRAPYPTDHMIREWKGHFAFVLFDNTTQRVLVSADCQGKVSLFWGVTSEGSLVFSDDFDVLKNGCFKSSSPFPPGCFFSSEQGLQSFDHPLNEVKASPRGKGKDGVKFEVDRPEQPVGDGPGWASAF